MKKMLSLLMVALVQITSLFAGEITVTTGPELTVAINKAAAHAKDSTKIIIKGTLQGNFIVPTTKHSISLVGKKGTNPTLDGQLLGTTLTVELGATVTVEHLTITNGKSTSTNTGGAILNLGTMRIRHSTISNSFSSSTDQYATLLGGGIYNNNQMTIKDSLITGNRADRGGGIYNRGTMTIKHSKISNNTLSITPMYCYGGGLYNDGYLLITEDSTITGNSAPTGYAGGVYTEGKMTIKDSTISYNSAFYNTGGIENDVFLEIEKCAIFDNVAQNGVGGGVYNDYGVMIIKEANIYNNTAQNGNGGGVYNSWDLTIKDSSIYDNTAPEGNGGGVYNDWLMAIYNSSITGNTAPEGDGGGVYNSGGNYTNMSTITYTKIAHNSAVHGGGIANEDGAFLELIKSTVTKNTATYVIGGGGGIYNPSPSELFLKQSKVYKNISGNIVPPLF